MTLELTLSGRVALVTGASRGIGQATVKALVDAGAGGVVLTSRKPANLEQSVSELADAGVPGDRLHTVAARADVDDDAARTVAETIERFGSCDILVNNAGTNPAFGPLMDVDLGALDKTWQVNQRAPLVWAREAYVRWMREHGGSIVNVASVGGIRPSPGLGAYNISKAALIHMTHSLAFELAPSIRVNAVAPGIVKTRLAEALWKSDEAAAASVHPLDRLGEPQDVAYAITYLCSDQARWVTGVVFPIDGGAVGASSALR